MKPEVTGGDALDAIEQQAAGDDLHRTSRADIDFQDARTESSGVAGIGPMLQLLVEQPRRLLAALGLGYAFPIDSVPGRDRQTFAAVEQWRAKIDDAAAYMVEHLRTTRLRSGEA